jgi:hypothetical protein
LSELSENERQIHVNSCLDQGFKCKPKKFSNLSESICENEPVKSNPKIPVQQVEKVKEEKQTTESLVETDNSPTPQTSSSTNDEAVTNQPKPTTDILKDAVPNCPICGKILHTMNVLNINFQVFSFRHFYFLIN